MEKISRRSFVNKFGIGVGATAIVTALPSFVTYPEENKVWYTGKKINIALCGLGRYAEILAEGIVVSEYCHLAGIVTGTPEKAAKWKSQYQIPDKNIYDYDNFDSILNNKDIDMVYVVLPNAMHKEFVLRAAKAGKHVIVEKPMAITPEDCEEMMAACKKAGVQLAVGYRLHYEPNHLEIKRLGQDKVFGPVRYIEVGLGYATYDRSKPDAEVNYADKSEWHNYRKMSGGGSLVNLGIYCIQASRYVLGEEPIAVTARFAPTDFPKRFEQVEETILWQMEFPSGAISNCSSSSGFDIDRFYASADEGSFELSPAVSYGPFKGKSPKGEFNFPVINQQQTQVDAICKLVLEKKLLPNHITGEEGLKDVRIIEAIYKAAETGKRIALL